MGQEDCQDLKVNDKSMLDVIRGLLTLPQASQSLDLFQIFRRSNHGYNSSNGVKYMVQFMNAILQE
jgi:hypothetical protein